jgi:hypothetical protein
LSISEKRATAGASGAGEYDGAAGLSSLGLKRAARMHTVAASAAAAARTAIRIIQPVTVITLSEFTLTILRFPGAVNFFVNLAVFLAFAAVRVAAAPIISFLPVLTL